MIRILEYTWLFMSLTGLSASIYVMVKQDETTQTGLFVLFTCIAIVMYLVRRRQRINMDRAKANDKNGKYL